MSAGGARRGRRDNGLDAADFAVAGDVDPRVGEHLLDVLGAGGIAAYLQPSSDLNPVTRTTTMPPRPVDRLYVDSAHLETARGYLAKLASEEEPPQRTNGHDPDVEAAWAKIIAGYDQEPEPAAAPPWPAAENLPDPTAGTLTVQADPTRPADPPPSPPARRPSATDFSGVSLSPRTDDGGPSLLDGLDTFGDALPGEPTDDEGYTPPPPPPLPRISKYAVAGLLGIIVGFVLFLAPELIPIDRAIVTVIGFLAILAGFITLISRLRHGNDDDYDPSDGARV
ncbi:DUF308 domain-containing protein [Asanoa sp. NPDC049573]|uniref:DUF308 domain-containing protein n=1 Tax=Asanoa sp. NPDC049573 TaxID=3155396 RepID=UPI00341FA312